MSVSINLPNKPSAQDLRFSLLEQRVELLVQHLYKLSQSKKSSILLDREADGRALVAPGPKVNGLGVGLDLPTTPATSTLELGSTPASVPTTPAMEEEDLLERPTAKLALQILNIIQRYGQNTSPSDVPWAGKARFLPVVERYVKNNDPVRMVLPAFPFKSPNRVDKTLGALPDLGEELALQHLNGLCESIKDVYEPGATVTITSDGLVYNDLMGISDEEVWEYSEGVRDIITEKDLKYVDTLRIADILMHAGCYRRELVAMWAPKDFDGRQAVRNDKDIGMTYKGYIKFLTKDLAHSKVRERVQNTSNPNKRFKKEIEQLAYKMIDHA